jgi:hypothetical protein
MSFSLKLKPIPSTIPKPATIGLYLPTRNRSLQCLSVLTCWKKFAADEGNLKILVGCDYDDTESIDLMKKHGYEVRVFDKDVITNGERSRILGETLDVDIYLAIVDYWFCTSPGWDNNLRNIMQNNEVTNLQCTHEIMSFNFTAISRKWRDLANHLESPFFPFWFCDQWRLEMACFVFNKSPELQGSISCYGKHERTNHLYELDFWWGLFHALRPLRLRQCHEIAKAYGYAPEDWKVYIESRRTQIDNFTRLDFNKRISLAATEAQFGDKRPPSEKYKKAKARALQYIADEGLEIWKMRPLY